VRAGYDMDIIPSDLATYGRDAKSLLEQLQSQDQRLFLVTFLILTTGKSRQELDNNILQVKSIAQKYSCNITRLDYEQESGMVSCLPLAKNEIAVERALTTSAAAIFVPFTTQELFQSSPEAIYSGLNAVTGNMIYLDRKLLKAPNGLILGTPGSGKSFTTKREIYSVFLSTKDDIIICDPEAEYDALTESLKGQVIRVSPVSHQHINPMDINENYSDDDEPIKLKSDFILSFCELIMDNENGLGYRARSVIDRAVRTVYERYFQDPSPERMPILQDLYEELLRQGDADSKDVAAGLEIYVTGSLSVFNHRTNVDINQRVVCYDIKDLGKQLKKLGMLIVQDQVWNRVTVNRYQQKTTRYFIDEFHLLLREAQTAAYSIEIWKRFRKWGGIPTGITQNVKDLLSSREVENIFENSEYICMLNQAAGDREILAQHLGISPHQMRFVTRVGEGQGLIFYGNLIMPFVDHFPKDTQMYRIMTTKLSETQKKMPEANTGLQEEAGNTEEAATMKSPEGQDNTDIQKNTASKNETVMQKTAGQEKKTGNRKLKRGAASLHQAEKQEKPRRPASKSKKAKPVTPEQETERLLKAMDRFMSGRRKVWSGSASELSGLLKGVAISPYAITRKLHENAEQLQRYGITIDSGRDRDRRVLILMRIPKAEEAAETAGGSKA
ncbi:MAG: ATP-binding protein, partial [Eubacterium sp.]|nr:ATP-binding protein [Eubacterium sp.]